MGPCFSRAPDSFIVGSPLPVQGTEVAKLDETVQVLVHAFRDMQGRHEEMQRLNLNLQRDNERLRSALQEQSSETQWHMFDVVERHYKQLEHHRQRMQTGSGDDVPEGDVLSEYGTETQE